MTGYFKFFSGPHGAQGRASVVVKITADDGTVGWGESLPIAKWSYETLETATIAIPIRRAVLMTRQAISPRFAIRIFENMHAPLRVTGRSLPADRPLPFRIAEYRTGRNGLPCRRTAV